MNSGAISVLSLTMAPPMCDECGHNEDDEWKEMFNSIDIDTRGDDDTDTQNPHHFHPSSSLDNKEQRGRLKNETLVTNYHHQSQFM